MRRQRRTSQGEKHQGKQVVAESNGAAMVVHAVLQKETSDHDRECTTARRDCHFVAA